VILKIFTGQTGFHPVEGVGGKLPSPPPKKEREKEEKRERGERERERKGGREGERCIYFL
jgi:hypothetical protein